MSFFNTFVVINGFLSISFEILAIRFFAPFYGSGTIQTSAIIGTILLFYSAGNFLSHRHKTENYVLKRNIVLAILFHGILLTHPSLEILHQVYTHLEITNYYLKLFLTNLLILAPIAFIYGQNVPNLIEIRPDQKMNYTLGFATVGSFLGSVLTAVLLVYFLPASMMALINCALAILLGFILLKKRVILALTPLLLISFYINRIAIKNFFDWETGIATYAVDVKKDYKGLKINNEMYSSMIHENWSGPYNEIIHREILDNPVKQKVLVLGSGGFGLSVKNQHHDYLFVDIDPKIKEAVAKTFNPKPYGEFVHQDARAFLLETKNKYDVIIQDVFSHYEIPKHLLTREHLLKVKERLQPNGFFVINFLHKGLIGPSETAGRIISTVNSVFGQCYYLPNSHRKLYQEPQRGHQSLGICVNNDQKYLPITDEMY